MIKKHKLSVSHANKISGQRLQIGRRFFMRVIGMVAIGITSFARPAFAQKILSTQRDSQRVVIVPFSNKGQRQASMLMEKIFKTKAQWQAQLSPEAYSVTREAGTERAYSGAYWHRNEPGLYRCICCDTPLFDARTKFDSGTGWPSFWDVLATENVFLSADRTFNMQRTAVTCRRCDAHLGHLFEDGPQPTGLRYCMNSVALHFVPLAKSQEMVVLAGGCFWGMQAVFERVRGVQEVLAGYAGGSASQARYENVSSGNTGHAEAVKISYDPSHITFEKLLDVYFSVAHDPTQLNQQGPDHGSQYRSAIFYTTDEQKNQAQEKINQLQRSRVFAQAITTQVIPLPEFYAAETEHQNYADHHPDNPYIVIHDAPKVVQLKKQFPDLFVEVKK